MIQVKMFKAQGLVETETNRWLQEHQSSKIIDIKLCSPYFDTSGIVCTIVLIIYEE